MAISEAAVNRKSARLRQFIEDQGYLLVHPRRDRETCAYAAYSGWLQVRELTGTQTYTVTWDSEADVLRFAPNERPTPFRYDLC